jgi:hypothetical protein
MSYIKSESKVVTLRNIVDYLVNLNPKIYKEQDIIDVKKTFKIKLFII